MAPYYSDLTCLPVVSLFLFSFFSSFFPSLSSGFCPFPSYYLVIFCLSLSSVLFTMYVACLCFMFFHVLSCSFMFFRVSSLCLSFFLWFRVLSCSFCSFLFFPVLLYFLALIMFLSNSSVLSFLLAIYSIYLRWKYIRSSSILPNQSTSATALLLYSTTWLFPSTFSVACAFQCKSRIKFRWKISLHSWVACALLALFYLFPFESDMGQKPFLLGCNAGGRHLATAL